MSYDSLHDLKIAINMGALPDGARLKVARDIVFLQVNGEGLFDKPVEEVLFEALALLGIPAEACEND